MDIFKFSIDLIIESSINKFLIKFIVNMKKLNSNIFLLFKYSLLNLTSPKPNLIFVSNWSKISLKYPAIIRPKYHCKSSYISVIRVKNLFLFVRPRPPPFVASSIEKSKKIKIY